MSRLGFVYRVWLRSTFQVEWPSEPFHFSSYLEARAAEPCGKSIPASLLKTLIFMEHAAENCEERADSVPHPQFGTRLKRLSWNWRSVDSKPSRQAMHLPVALVMALEKAVMDLRFPRFPSWIRMVSVSQNFGAAYGSTTQLDWILAASPWNPLVCKAT